MTLDFQKLADAPRLLLEARLKPLQGERFQPTGFADLGPARYALADGTEMLLVESAQSVANRMEAACWDEATDDLIAGLTGLPYVRIDCGDLGRTNTIRESHRLNSAYLWQGTDTDSASKFRKAFLEDLGIPAVRMKKGKEAAGASKGDHQVPGVLDFRRLHRAVFKWDANSVLHGLFLEKVAGRLRMARALSGFVEAAGAEIAESGGAKVDHVLPSPKVLGLSADEGFGNVPFHRTEFTARTVTAYFNLDLALLRGYGFPESAYRLLVALALFKVRRFLSTGLRLRTACDFDVLGDLTVTRPEGFTVPDERSLLDECRRLITACQAQQLFAGVTEVKWESGKRSGKRAAADDAAEPQEEPEDEDK